MQHRVPRRLGVGPGPLQQLPRQLAQGGFHLAGLQIVGDLPHHKGPAAKLLAGKAKLRQQVQVVQQRHPLLRGWGKDHGGQQGLCHGLVACGLHAVEVHPLVGGVFVDEVDRVPLLHDEVGLQDFSGQPPRRFLGGHRLRRGRRDRHRFRCLGLGRRLQ